jgi:hypothetical protein
VKLQFGKSNRAPLQMINDAKRDQSADLGARPVNRSFDEIWCIFDRDDHNSFDEATQAAAKAGIQIAVSNPCFELWLVLHVSDQTAHISPAGAQTRARDLNLVDGKHLSGEKLHTWKNSYQAAKRRAVELDKMHERNGSPEGANPSSGVWRIVDRLQDQPG